MKHLIFFKSSFSSFSSFFGYIIETLLCKTMHCNALHCMAMGRLCQKKKPETYIHKYLPVQFKPFLEFPKFHVVLCYILIATHVPRATFTLIAANLNVVTTFTFCKIHFKLYPNIMANLTASRSNEVIFPILYIL